MLGEARSCHAIAPTKGLRKNGIRLSGSSFSRHGQLVRALIHASETPKNAASSVEPVLISSVLAKALRMMRSWTNAE
ncbi:hypothetical protein D3C83_65720 [compost metagenome]